MAHQNASTKAGDGQLRDANGRFTAKDDATQASGGQSKSKDNRSGGSKVSADKSTRGGESAHRHESH